MELFFLQCEQYCIANPAAPLGSQLAWLRPSETRTPAIPWYWYTISTGRSFKVFSFLFADIWTISTTVGGSGSAHPRHKNCLADPDREDSAEHVPNILINTGCQKWRDTTLSVSMDLLERMRAALFTSHRILKPSDRRRACEFFLQRI